MATIIAGLLYPESDASDSSGSNLYKGGGRGGGGRGGGGSGSDNWNAPILVMIIYASELTFFILILIASISILSRIKMVEKSARASKFPYALASLAALCLSILYLLAALQTYKSTGNHVLGAQASVNYTSAITFLYAVDIAFRPIAILWLCHFRGRLIATGAMVRKDAFVSSTWKKIVDWCFVVVTLVVGIIYASLTTYVNNAILKGNVLTAAQRLNYVRILKVVHRVIVAVIVLFAINVIVSLIALKVAQKRAKILDKVATSLLLITLPFVIVDAAEALFAEIWISTQKNYDTTLFSLIMIIIEGASRLMIYVSIVTTMKFVSAPPSAHQGDYTAVSTTGQPTPGDHEKAGSGWDPRPPSLGQYQQPPHDYSYQPYQPYTPPPKQDYGYQPYAQPPPQDQTYQPYATPLPPQDHIYQPYAPPAGPPPGR